MQLLKQYENYSYVDSKYLQRHWESDVSRTSAKSTIKIPVINLSAFEQKITT